jgi:hypothetical protein
MNNIKNIIYILLYKMGIFEFLESKNIEPDEYLLIARRAAKKHGYDQDLLHLSDKPNYKLMYNNIHFGANLYNDFIIYTLLYRQGKFTLEYINNRRKAYLARSEAIEGDWKNNKLSKNNLARNILW